MCSSRAHVYNDATLPLVKSFAAVRRTVAVSPPKVDAIDTWLTVLDVDCDVRLMLQVFLLQVSMNILLPIRATVVSSSHHTRSRIAIRLPSPSLAIDDERIRKPGGGSCFAGAVNRLGCGIVVSKADVNPPRTVLDAE